jgi:GWxTD domain-containing protein
MKYFLPFIILMTINPLFGQRDYREVNYLPTSSKVKIPQLSPILVKPFPVVHDNSNYKIYFLIEVMYDFLQFTRQNDEYFANFQIELTFTDKNTKQTYVKIWDSKCELRSFRETNRWDKYFFTLDSLIIPAGSYNTLVKYHDLQAKRKSNIRFSYSLPPIEGIFAASPLYLRTTNGNQPFGQFFPKSPKSLQQYLPFNRSYDIFLYAYAPGDSLLSLKINFYRDEEAQTVFSRDTVVAVNQSEAKYLFSPPFREWQEGHYILKIHYKTSQDSFRHEIPIELTWFGKPKSLMELTYALKPLKEITTPEEFKKINSGNRKAKYQKFLEYWATKDPTPSTAFNEVLFEFYTRVDTVDFTWGGRRRNYGWRTDPGRIYLLFGKPSEIKDESLNPINPYLKWVYRLGDRQKIFIFEAVNGRKSYKLIEEREEIL